MKVKDILNQIESKTVVILQNKKGKHLYGSRKVYNIMQDYPADYVTWWFLNREVVRLGTNYQGDMIITIENAEIADMKNDGLNAWIALENNKYQCTECGFQLKGGAYCYCPHCGTKMKGGILR